jgi:transcriptional regulator with XRE-family HTH domain
MSPHDLKTWRKKNNYSQSSLASVLGVAALTISKWERGVAEIPAYLHLALASVKKRDEKPLRGRPPRGKEVKKKNGKHLQTQA